ncbi:MAG: aquaporin [Phycisphaerales bacterium]|nr:aquaporin [Phycisphaerales bacterium]
MLAACSAVVLAEHPASALRRAVPSTLARRAVVAVLMGLTAMALIYSPWGQRSGAHMNPAVTLTFYLLGKVRGPDAAGYILAQFAGGMLGVALARRLLGERVMHESVRCAATRPGRHGLAGALLGELAIAFLMMTMVLHSTSHPATAPFTGVFAGVLVALFITVEAPLSGMSMNPARTLASAVPTRAFRGLWIYFIAPPAAMAAAAALHAGVRGAESIPCCKLQHPDRQPCIFGCRQTSR